MGQEGKDIAGTMAAKERAFTPPLPFLWPHLWHTEVPRLGVKSEL